MQAGDCLQILREIKDVSFASVDEQGNPQVRIIDVMLVEDDKLYFCTSRGKDFHRQMLQHPQIAITGMNRWCACRGARFVCHSRSIGFIVFLMKTRL